MQKFEIFGVKNLGLFEIMVSLVCPHGQRGSIFHNLWMTSNMIPV